MSHLKWENVKTNRQGILQSDAILGKILYYELWWEIYRGRHLIHLTDKGQRNINQASHMVSTYSLNFTFLLTLFVSWLNKTLKPNILTIDNLWDKWNCVSSWFNILNVLNVYRYILYCKHKISFKFHSKIVF